MCLEDGKPKVRDAAVEALRTLSRSAVACLEDTVLEERDAAVEALRAQNLALVTAALGHAAPHVRASGAEAVAAIAALGDAVASAALLALVDDQEVDVVWAALRALLLVAERGDAAARAGALRFARDPEADEQVQEAAVELLAAMAGEGDGEVQTLFCRLLPQGDELPARPEVARQAFRGLMKLCPDLAQAADPDQLSSREARAALA